MKKQTLFTLLSLIALTASTMHAMNSDEEWRERKEQAEKQLRYEFELERLTEAKRSAEVYGDALIAAAKNNDTTSARETIKSAFDVHESVDGASIKDLVLNRSDNDDKTALIHAVERGHRDMIRLLLDIPAIHINKQDQDGITPLDWAQDGEIRRMLIEADAKRKTKCPCCVIS